MSEGRLHTGADVSPSFFDCQILISRFDLHDNTLDLVFWKVIDHENQSCLGLVCVFRNLRLLS